MYKRQRYAAAMLGTDETSAQLLIYELTGRQIDQVDLAGQIVMDFGFFSNGALLWVMTMDTSGSVPMSIITTYQPGRQTLGSVREIEEVVYRTLFQASQLRAVGTTYIKTVSYTHLGKALEVFGARGPLPILFEPAHRENGRVHGTNQMAATSSA